MKKKKKIERSEKSIYILHVIRAASTVDFDVFKRQQPGLLLSIYFAVR